jgi:hypothetical protein
VTIKRASDEPVAVSQVLGLEDDPATSEVRLQLGTPDGRMVEIACSYRAAHVLAAALGRWQGMRTADQAGRKTARLAATPGRLPCCP